MEEQHILKIAGELKITDKQVEAVALLLENAATVPFIARYRKEVTGSLDEVVIMAIRDRLEQLADLDKRRKAILESLEKQGKLTDELKKSVMAAETMTVLEDIYLPYRPKRRTRATIAKEKGLEPLAKMIFEQGDFDPLKEAEKFISAEKDKEVDSAEIALAGARDIIAEWISEDQDARASIRSLYHARGEYTCKVMPGKEDDAVKYKDYYEWVEAVIKAPSHRVLAMRRGAKEKLLALRITVEEDRAIEILEELFVKQQNDAALQVKLAVKDGFKRLMMISMETDIRIESKKSADEEAIKVFVENLRQLLLGSPLGEKATLAIDPAFRTGCKVVCLDKQGKLLYNDAIFPLTSDAAAAREGHKIMAWCQKYSIEAIAIGNGTASRESEAFVKGIGLPKEIQVVMVNESGASVYSASQVARDEFPDYDITVRGAVSIGRRLMDPLAELVKIDAKSIGVGQYQHDVDQTLLKRSLDDTVMSCVNAVGVEVNTASKQLLTYVSGVGPALAERIVARRNESGAFNSRQDIKSVSGLGAKTFEQCAGFLRIGNAENPLDASAVHPESYSVVSAMAADLGCSVAELIASSELRDKIKLEKYVTDTVGLPTLVDIKSELSKPGRDPRKQFEAFSFDEKVNTMKDLVEGMELPGIVTNITAFGVFVDVGVHQDGLVHISELADRYVKDPADVVKVHQVVKVRVLEIDAVRKRISMSMKKKQTPDEKKAASEKTAKSGSSRPPRSGKGPKKPAQRPAKKTNSNQGFGDSLGLKLTFGS